MILQYACHDNFFSKLNQTCISTAHFRVIKNLAVRISRQSYAPFFPSGHQTLNKDNTQDYRLDFSSQHPTPQTVYLYIQIH